MTMKYKTALRAVWGNIAQFLTKRRRATTIAALALTLIIAPTASFAGLRKPAGTPLQQFGFATGPEVQTLTQVHRYYDVVKRVTGTGGIIRTGLTWDPTRHNVPDFRSWTATKLQPALAKGLVILPRISTNGPGGFRIPTDAQWILGLRQIVRVLGPGGIYAKGGTYTRNGYTVSIPAHPGFAGLTDFELWNEPDSRGSVGGTMTPLRTAQLLKAGAIAMRDEASKLGFQINIIGPGFDGVEVADIDKLWRADNTIFKYIDTLTVHAYSRVSVLSCTPAYAIVRCIRNFELVRAFLDSHGGAHVHLGTTEGGYAGATGTCNGPQVLSEQLQAQYTEEAFKWLRGRPGLDIDFWITYHAIDGTGKYSYGCDSGIYDLDFWEHRLGVVRADLSMKPMGYRMNSLISSWR
jgi:hypothetical protein